MIWDSSTSTAMPVSGAMTPKRSPSKPSMETGQTPLKAAVACCAAAVSPRGPGICAPPHVYGIRQRIVISTQAYVSHARCAKSSNGDRSTGYCCPGRRGERQSYPGTQLFAAAQYLEKIMAGNVVCQGALCVCNQGAAPTPLTVTSQS